MEETISLQGPINCLGLLECLKVGSCSGYHTIQRRYGCYILPRGYFRNGFFEVVFNDHDSIRLNEDLSTWTPVGKFAEILREEWDSSGFTQNVKNFLEVECVDLFLTELEYGKEILLRTGKDRNCLAFCDKSFAYMALVAV